MIKVREEWKRPLKYYNLKIKYSPFKLKHFLNRLLKRITKGPWLVAWFIGWPGFVFGIGVWWFNWGNEVQTWHLTAYGMQLGAFTIFIRRLNSLFKHYHKKNWGFREAIWYRIKSFFGKKTELVVDGSVSNVGQTTSALGFKHLPKGSTKKEIIEWLNKKIPEIYNYIAEESKALEKKIKDLRDKINEKINKMQVELNKEKRATEELQLPNLERELVAVLWLMLAVGIFATTNLVA